MKRWETYLGKERANNQEVQVRFPRSNDCKSTVENTRRYEKEKKICVA